MANWFRECGLPVDAVVDQVQHDKVRMDRDPKFVGMKNPAWFDIDLHFDDLQAVVDQSPDGASEILLVDPKDPDWVKTIITSVQDRDDAGGKGYPCRPTLR